MLRECGSVCVCVCVCVCVLIVIILLCNTFLQTLFNEVHLPAIEVYSSALLMVSLNDSVIGIAFMECIYWRVIDLLPLLSIHQQQKLSYKFCHKLVVGGILLRMNQRANLIGTLLMVRV